jgi:hypothetical protein
LTLFAASAALLALLIASYAGRGAWIACCSTAVTAIAVAGFVFVSTAATKDSLRARAAWLASGLPELFDEQTLQALTAPIEHLALQVAQERSGAGNAEPAGADSNPVQASVATGWFGAGGAPKADANSPVIWLLDDGKGPATAPVGDGSAIAGVNSSNQDLSQVRATLKPDASQREVPLALSVEGQAAEGAAVIPAGARFSLTAETPDAVRARSSGGAILTFRYLYAGQQKSTILYLNAATLAHFASRG